MDSRCQCLTSKGTQCLNKPSTKPGANQQFCWLHQQCKSIATTQKVSPVKEKEPIMPKKVSPVKEKEPIVSPKKVISMKKTEPIVSPKKVSPVKEKEPIVSPKKVIPKKLTLDNITFDDFQNMKKLTGEKNVIVGPGDFGIYTELYSREYSNAAKKYPVPKKYIFAVGSSFGKDYKHHKVSIRFKGGKEMSPYTGDEMDFDSHKSYQNDYIQISATGEGPWKIVGKKKYPGEGFEFYRP